MGAVGQPGQPSLHTPGPIEVPQGGAARGHGALGRRALAPEC